MGKWILILMVTVSFAPWTRAVEGSASSGGGKAVVCRGLDGRIQSAEVLDLFDGRTRGLTIKALGSTYEENLAAARAKFEALFAGYLYFDPENNLFTKAARDFHLLPNGIHPKRLEDADEDVLPPEGCKLEQLAVYRDDQILLVDREIWSALDPLNRAALMVHEVVYRQERSASGATNSRRARKVVAHIFSDVALTPLMQGVPENALDCRTFLNDEPLRKFAFEFYLYPNPQSPREQIIQFLVAKNKLAYDLSRSVVPRWPEDSKSFETIDLKSAIDPEVEIHLARASDEKGTPLHYFFDEPEGRHVIHCERRGLSESTLTVAPSAPIVITADTVDTSSKRIKAPWFSHRLTLETKKTVTITGFEEVIIAPDGASVVTRQIPIDPVEVRGRYTTDSLYVGDLPLSRGPGFGYQVQVFARGWIGPKNHPGKVLELKGRFQTN